MPTPEEMGAQGPLANVQQQAQRLVAPATDAIAKHPGWVFIILLIIIIYLLYMWFMSSSETWTAGPTATAAYQRTEWGLGGGESMDSTDPTDATAATTAVSTVTDPNSAQFPGSPSWTVLNSPDFACATRTKATDDAWGWQFQQAQDPTLENFDSYGRPTSPGDLTRIMAGHSN